MDKIESDLLKTQETKPSVWYRYIDDVFFIWTHGQQKLNCLPMNQVKKTSPF